MLLVTKKKRLFSAACLLSLSLLWMGPAVAQPPARIIDVDTMDVMKLFSAVNMTPPSNVSANEHEAIINARIQCFAQNFSYARRVRICMEKYLQDIVGTARANVSGRPDIGLFVKEVAYCPSIHNFCMGQMDNGKISRPERCVTFERQCIDYTLDKYWRGVPLYDNMQLRVE